MPLKVKKRPGSDVWYVVGQLGGRRINRSSRSTRKDDAEALRDRLQAEIWQRRVLGAQVDLTFAQAVALYLGDGGDDRFLDPVLRHFKTTPIREITGLEIRAGARKLYPLAGPDTWNRQVITPARAVINRAAAAGKCGKVVVRQFRREDPDVNFRPRKKTRAIDRAWIDKFRAAASTRYLAAIALFMFQSGWRIGEATAIRPWHLDLPARRVRLETSKNGEAIEAHLTVEMMVELANLTPRRGKVFGYANKSSVYGPWATTCKRAGIDYVPPHQSGRHSFATEMIERHGKSIAATAEAGHWKSHRLLSESYTHPEELKSTIDEVFGGQVTSDLHTRRRPS